MLDCKKNLRCIRKVAKAEFMKVILNPRLVVIAVLYVFIKNCCVLPLSERAEIMGGSLHILEPFIAVGNSSIMLLILPLLQLFFISDFPKRDGNRLLFVNRIGRRRWVAGQLLFSVLAAGFFLAVTILTSVCTVFGRFSFCAGWSDTVTKFDVMFPDLAGGYASDLIPARLYNQMTPVQVAVHTALLLFMYFVLLGALMVLLDELNLRVARLICIVAVIVFGTALTTMRQGLMWIFPMPHSIVWLHFHEYFRKQVYPIGYSYLYFGVSILIVSALAFWCVRYMEFYSVEEG